MSNKSCCGGGFPLSEPNQLLEFDLPPEVIMKIITGEGWGGDYYIQHCIAQL